MYKKLLPEIQEQIQEDKKLGKESPFKTQNQEVLRRDSSRDKENLWRPAFVRDTEKILHLPVYNRYADKTQVFSFYKNDDITRRALHVQLVSRIARSIGSVLGLNTDLIEAIALGHDIGHTPFGHAGESFLSEIMEKEIGVFFNHNIHSARVLDVIFKRNISLQTLDGIICHNGEFELKEYKPVSAPKSAEEGFARFDSQISDCDTKGNDAIKKLVPITLEACVVRICDMIAYLGKDRQDALTAKIIESHQDFTPSEIGTSNAEIINNLTVDIINNSYGKNYLLLSADSFEALKQAKKENYQKIYKTDMVSEEVNCLIKPMFSEIYYKLLDDLIKGNKDSVIFKHHIDFVNKNTFYYAKNSDESQISPYEKTEPNRIVADFIASMTDDYFIELHEFLFPDSKLKINYKSYFEDLKHS